MICYCFYKISFAAYKMQISFAGNDGNTTVVVECVGSNSNKQYQLDTVSEIK